MPRLMRLFALRGAIDVSANEADAILARTEELLHEVMERNSLSADDCVSCIFTVTPDLDAEFPAVAARRIGLDRVPLLCAREIAVPERCHASSACCSTTTPRTTTPLATATSKRPRPCGWTWRLLNDRDHQWRRIRRRPLDAWATTTGFARSARPRRHRVRRQRDRASALLRDRRHFHERQEETYFIHRGTVEIEFGDGSAHRLGPGAVARVDPATVRMLRNVGDEDVVYLCVGGEDGYVGRDGRLPDENEPRARPSGPPDAA